MTAPTCRFCGSTLRHTFCDLGLSPVSNAFVEEKDLQTSEPFFPLHAYVCASCFLVQLAGANGQDRKQHFHEDYAYFSSYSESWLRHARDYVEGMMDRFGLGADSLVVEVASNDGYLLQYFVEKKVPVLGIEPAANVAEAAEKINVPTWVTFFGASTAEELVSTGRQADLLLGNNVLAHVPDINDFVKGAKTALKPGGVVTFEFPHLLRLMEQNQFDTIYHEHYSYLSWLAVETIFSHHGLTLFDVDELPTHGGSLRVYGRHADDVSKPLTDAVHGLRAAERAAGLDTVEAYLAFQSRVHETKRALLRFLVDARDAGKRIVGYGAPAKGNTLLNYCGVRTDFVDFTVDRSPRKQGRYLPGVRIPVRAPDTIFECKPDYVLILPWNIKDEIMSQMDGIREWGGRFVVPIPEVQVIS